MKIWVGRWKKNLSKYGKSLPQNCVFHFKVVFPLIVQNKKVKENIAGMGIFSKLLILNVKILLQLAYFSHLHCRKKKKGNVFLWMHFPPRFSHRKLA